MVYKQTAESEELRVYAANDYDTYQRMRHLEENLKKKIAKGIYNSDKAVDGFYRIATVGSDAYKREFGYGFSVQDRFSCAVDMEETFRGDVEYEEN